MAKTTILFCWALFALLWMTVLTPGIQCAGEEGGHPLEEEKKDSVSTDSPLDIPREQKKLGKEVAALNKATYKQIETLKASIKSLNSEIEKIARKEGKVKRDEEEWEGVLERTKKVLQSISMEVAPVDLSSRKGIRKTVKQIAAKCEAEIDKIDAEYKKLKEERNVKVTELRAKAEAKYRAICQKKFAEKQQELRQTIEEFERMGGTMEELHEFLRTPGPGADAKIKLNNEILWLSDELKQLKGNMTSLDLDDEVCAEESAQIEAANELYSNSIRQRNMDLEPFSECLHETNILKNKMNWLELGKKAKLATPRELQQVKEMQAKQKAQEGEVKLLYLRAHLESVLEEFVGCLSLSRTLTGECRKQRKSVEKLAQEVAKSRNGRTEGDQKSVDRKSSLVESLAKFGKLFGLGDHEQKLSTSVAQVLSVYDRVVPEAREKMRAGHLLED